MDLNLLIHYTFNTTGARISSDSGNKSIEEPTWEDPEETKMKKKVKKKKGINGMSEIRKWLRKNGES